MLNDEQQEAVSRMLDFIYNEKTDKEESFLFVLSGPAGCGKTYCMRELLTRITVSVCFTAPTNKATKVLREQLNDAGLHPHCRTIFSLLGLKMTKEGNLKVLTDEIEPENYEDYEIIVVDECSMVNKELFEHIKEAISPTNIKVIFLGDEYQLPPVKETISPVWKLKNKATLAKVMRHDNEILQLATHVRGQVGKLCTSLRLESSNSNGCGVFRCKASEFVEQIKAAARRGEFLSANSSKAIAWRNVKVDALNELIRKELFKTADVWAKGDRIIIIEPVIAISEASHKPITVAHTDDEGVIISWSEREDDFYPDLLAYDIDVRLDTNTDVHLHLISRKSEKKLRKMLSELAFRARKTPSLWGEFWKLKENFNSARYAYALTAHRSQGSTYDAVFVDRGDILLNRNRQEALRCLYVAVTRPKEKLYLL